MLINRVEWKRSTLAHPDHAGTCLEAVKREGGYSMQQLQDNLLRL
jgi:hypothetical protein